MGTISGTTHIRPVRVGFVAAKVRTDAIREAARLASRVWGGMYFPFLEAEDPGLLQKVEALAVDVLHPLDDASTTRAITEATGFGWRGRGDWGPFGGPDDSVVREGLLPIDRLAESGGAEDWSISWGDDGMAPLYDVWFGRPARNSQELWIGFLA